MEPSKIENHIGITTTIPIEVVLAAGRRVVDLNNLFITSDNAGTLINLAESHGFPRSLCAWIKGIYGASVYHGIKEIVGVIEGDCSNTRVMTDVMTENNVAVHPFSFPYSGELHLVRREIQSFMRRFDVSERDVEIQRQQLSVIRALAAEIDRLTWQEGKVTGFENHLHLVSCSDFNGDHHQFERDLRQTVKEYTLRKASCVDLPLAYIGVPPMTSDLYDYVETHGAKVVYNEVQREFSFPRGIDCSTIYEQYCNYTYPYSLDKRIEEIRLQIKKRGIKGILHYSQTFCHRAVEDIILKKKLDIPILSITSDRETTLDARTRLRLEAFLDMLHDRARGISI